MKLRHLKNSEIDFEKWDAALTDTHHPLIYANSWYLNIVSPNWEALVNEDYTILVPLPIKKVLGIKFIVQPPFCQQLGLFSEKYANCEVAKFSSQRLPFATIIYQTKNLCFKKRDRLTKERSNLILPLQKEFSQLFKAFNQNTKRNIKKATKHPQKINQTFCAETFIKFSQKHAPYSLSLKEWEVLKRIVEVSLNNKIGALWTVTNTNNTELCMGFFLNKFNRITFLSGHSSPEGFEQKSMFLLMDHVIKSHAESNKILDFEGGSLEGVARFYKGFGAIEEIYYIWQNPVLKPIVLMLNWLRERKQFVMKIASKNT